MDFLLIFYGKNKTLEIDGIDNDLKILERYKEVKSPNKKIFIQDICSPWAFHNDCIKKDIIKIRIKTI